MVTANCVGAGDFITLDPVQLAALVYLGGSDIVIARMECLACGMTCMCSYSSAQLD
jgi:hypothetical protein